MTKRPTEGALADIRTDLQAIDARLKAVEEENNERRRRATALEKSYHAANQFKKGDRVIYTTYCKVAVIGKVKGLCVGERKWYVQVLVRRSWCIFRDKISCSPEQLTHYRKTL